jgi:hypothetical protein
MLSANQIADIKAQTYAGVPSALDKIFQIKPLTIREILKMGYSTYNSRVGTLLLTED